MASFWAETQNSCVIPPMFKKWAGFNRLVGFRSIRTKLLVWMLVVGLLPLCLTGFFTYIKSRNAILESEGESLARLAQITAKEIDSHFFERYGDVQTCAAHGNRPAEALTASADPMVAEATGGDGLSVNFSAPIFDKQGKPYRVWSNRVSWARTIGSLLGSMKSQPGEGGIGVYPQLFSEKGILLWAKDGGRILKENYTPYIATSLRIAHMLAGQSSFKQDRSVRTDAMMIYDYAPTHEFLGFPGFNWRLMLSVPIADAMIPLNKQLVFFVYLMVFAAAGVWLTAEWISMAVARPLRESEEVLKCIAQGDFTRQDEEWVEIRISDTGTGIPAPVRDKLFDPFYTTKETGKRGGLGLSIAHFIIERKHGGKITFETKLNCGTTFIIRLPLTTDGPSLEVQQYLY